MKEFWQGRHQEVCRIMHGDCGNVWIAERAMARRHAPEKGDEGESANTEALENDIKDLGQSCQPSGPRPILKACSDSQCGLLFLLSYRSGADHATMPRPGSQQSDRVKLLPWGRNGSFINRSIFFPEQRTTYRR